MGLRHHSPTPQGAAVVAVPSSERHHLPIRHPQPATAGKAAAAAVVAAVAWEDGGTRLNGWRGWRSAAKNSPEKSTRKVYRRRLLRDGSILYKRSWFYTGIKITIQLQDNRSRQPWKTLRKMFSRCLTSRVTGYDQPPLADHQMPFTSLSTISMLIMLTCFGKDCTTLLNIPQH
ncbi:hypothetical protein Tco_1406157 [Tanacetum coccineum]